MPELDFDALHLACGERDFVQILHCPFGWPGGKTNLLSFIIPHLPYRERYIEPFGGSFAIGIAREPSKTDVFNDRYGGVVDFYRCLRNPQLYQQLIDRIEMSICAREEFVWCKETWESVSDPVERAARWFYMIKYSFASLTQVFGRSMSQGNCYAMKLHKCLENFPELHRRLRSITIENLDFRDCITQYDSPNAVFYIDPPYPDIPGIYNENLKTQDFYDLIELIENCQGFVALSGYHNPIFDNCKFWDEVFETKKCCSIASTKVHASGNNKNKDEQGLVYERPDVIEVLWIKK